ncbi:MAG: hypothetical protein ONB42_01815, partial [candidate division KSB1 bacterium]|nr:hypothetical protein [candidate division KSB1 bacterium]
GPTPSPLERIQNEFRWQILIKSDPKKDPSAHKMRATLERVVRFFRQANRSADSKFKTAGVRMIVDIDPINML